MKKIQQNDQNATILELIADKFRLATLNFNCDFLKNWILMKIKL